MTRGDEPKSVISCSLHLSWSNRKDERVITGNVPLNSVSNPGVAFLLKKKKTKKKKKKKKKAKKKKRKTKKKKTTGSTTVTCYPSNRRSYVTLANPDFRPTKTTISPHYNPTGYILLLVPLLKLVQTPLRSTHAGFGRIRIYVNTYIT
jgi:hypothetical protein